MGKSIASRFDNIDVTRSVLRAVIINDDELTLEMDFYLEPEHADYEAPGAQARMRFHPGLLKFAGISKLGLDRAEQTDRHRRGSPSSPSISRARSSTWPAKWGTIHLQARSIRVPTE